MSILGGFGTGGEDAPNGAKGARRSKKAEIKLKSRICLAGISTRICDRNFLRSVVLHPSGGRVYALQ
jgi:hypothetical protein